MYELVRWGMCLARSRQYLKETRRYHYYAAGKAFIKKLYNWKPGLSGAEGRITGGGKGGICRCYGTVGFWKNDASKLYLVLYPP